MTDHVSDEDLSKLSDNDLMLLALEAMIQVDYCQNGSINKEMASKYGSVEATHEIEESIKAFIAEHGKEVALQVHEAMRDGLMIELSKRKLGYKPH
jgi:hypothetical protein